MQAQRATARYWTQSRMASAKPLDISVKASRTASSRPVDKALVGTPTVVRPAGPRAATSAAPEHASLGGSVNPQLLAYNYPAPFTRYGLFPASQYNVYPNRAHGKLFFSQHTPSGDGSFVCSGTVVTSAGHWLVETAGHCVANSATHTFSFNVQFVPAYRSGLAPFGVWSAFQLWTKTAWISSGNLREDRGFVLLRNNSSGLPIQNVTGSEGIAFNQGYLQHVVDFGYPAAYPFNGATEQLCLASFEETDPFDTEIGSVPWGIGCDQTGGSSGGGWVIRYGAGGGYVNGHNDYKYIFPSRPLEMFSPYFDNSELSLYNCATDNVC
ncbi:MAG TPA: hypothetical protein VIV12_09000 [Streptosporangiaceae bacterium]